MPPEAALEMAHRPKKKKKKRNPPTAQWESITGGALGDSIGRSHEGGALEDGTLRPLSAR